MATKTITLEIDAYERLKRAKRTPRESFSEVVRRLPMPAGAITAGQYLALVRERGA
ncbi:MAG: antitoxin VapB family protein, partial [Chthoniobacterales bacterium]